MVKYYSQFTCAFFKIKETEDAASRTVRGPRAAIRKNMRFLSTIRIHFILGCGLWVSERWRHVCNCTYYMVLNLWKNQPHKGDRIGPHLTPIWAKRSAHVLRIAKFSIIHKGSLLCSIYVQSLQVVWAILDPAPQNLLRNFNPHFFKNDTRLFNAV